METATLLPFLIPLVAIELGIRIFVIFQITKVEERGERLRFDSVILWVLIVALVNFGWVGYLIFGKVEE
jgi:predicted DNA-binding transcriptional regulator